MNRLFAKVLTLAVLVAMVASIVPFAAPATAQDDDDVALLERIVAAAEAAEAYDSFVRTDFTQTDLNVSMNMMGFAFDQSQTDTSEYVSTIITGDNPSLVTVATVSRTMAGTDPTTFATTLSSSEVAAEVRLVDNVLYFNGEVVSNDGDTTLPTLPEGWVIISDDVSTAVASDVLDGTLGLNIQGFDLTTLGADLFETDEAAEGVSLDNILSLLDVAEDVSLSQATMDDGTAVDVITVTLNALDVYQSPLLSNSVPLDPTTASLVEAMFTDAVFEINFAIDDQERLVGLFFVIEISLQTDDISTLIDTGELGIPEGMAIGLDMAMVMEISQQYTDINAVDTAIEAPADAVAFP